MAPILFHAIGHLNLLVVCIESRQAYWALKSLATHKTDRSSRIWPVLASSNPYM